MDMCPKRHKSKWGHIFGTTGPTKMVHLSKFVEFYHGNSQNVFVNFFLHSYFKKNVKKVNFLTGLFRKKRLKGKVIFSALVRRACKKKG